jgi:hypothetical protein
MIKALKPLSILIMLCCAGTGVLAQHTGDQGYISRLNSSRDSLINLSEATFKTEDNQERFAVNATLIKTLVRALKTPGSFNYSFDSVKKITVLKSPDNSFRIFSWYVPLNNGTYRYFGTIQMATKDGQLSLLPLIDGTDNINDTNAITSNKNWFGARYYQIIPVIANGRQPYYVLLGWKGNNAKTSKKVIEILSFDKTGIPLFGKNVFDGAKGDKSRNRIIFEYNKLNSMTLTLDNSVKMIVFDHLAPFSPELEGNFEFYASDLSFDAYKLLDGRLKLVENIILKNEPNAMDELYIDPMNKNIVPEKKL